VLLVAALLCLGTGLFVGLSGEEPRVKVWFAVLCVCCASVCGFLWVETHYERWAFLAARINMTAAFGAAAAALMSMAIMCRISVGPIAQVIVAAAAVVNLVTVWLTDVYFTGAIHRYSWGLYVAGDPLFILNPILVTLVCLCTWVLLLRNLRTVHPIDRNRAKYALAAFSFLGASVLDYLPHFGIDLFGGALSALTMPLFAITFGYACLRYRLVAFRDWVARAAGWFITAVVVIAAYALVLEADARWVHADVTAAHAAAALLDLALFAALGTRLPKFLERVLGAAEIDFQAVVERLSSELMAILDEGLLSARMMAVCRDVFGCKSAAVLAGAEVRADVGLRDLPRAHAVVECEAWRRRTGRDTPLLQRYELLVPLWVEDGLIGAVAVSRRQDDSMYPVRALKSLRALVNIYQIALTNCRRAHELASRSRLDRYLAPQVVERVLAGHHDAIEDKRRMVLTIFFSDLKGFTEVAERLDPETLSTVLNEYLSEMAEIAFRHGGTLDKFIGDAVMVFFGAPVPSDPADHALRCVEMAIIMQQRLGELNREWQKRGLLDRELSARMGIHTGEATVGSFGSKSRLEYTAIGRAVNLASRLEGKGAPGAISMSAETWKLVRGRFVGRSRGTVEVKGFAQAVEVFEIDPAPPAAVAADRQTR
jgi:class 3 adenylate cyclase